jgi:hypothetical protein
LHDQRHQQAPRFHLPGRPLPHHLLEQDALVDYVLIDDPQPVAPRGDDEALMDLPERRRSESTESDISGGGIASAGNSPWPSSGVGLLACPGSAETLIGGALKSRRGSGDAPGHSSNAGRSRTDMQPIRPGRPPAGIEYQQQEMHYKRPARALRGG